MANMMTIAQLAKVQERDLQGYVIRNLLRESMLFEVLPFSPVGSLTFAGIRWRNLPSVASRRVNEGYTPSHGDTEQVWEAVYGLGGEINYDVVHDYLNPSNQVVDPVQNQIDMKITSMKIKFVDLFINGDPGTDPDQIKGLKYRVSNAPSRQLVNFTGASSTAFDPTSSTSNGRSFLNTLRKIHKRTNDRQHDIWVMNEDVMLGIADVLVYLNVAGGSILDVTQDSFEREFPTLYGSPIVESGLKKDQSTEIITNTETAGDGGSDATSIYCVSFDKKQGILGAQLNPLGVYDPLNGGEQESKPAKLRRIDWWWGLAGMGSYGVTRGWNLLDPGSWS